MKHLHFEKIPSTQLYLKEHLNEFTDSDILISCNEQTSGIGRRGHSWDFYDKSLAISFTLKPNPTATLTPIEIGILLSHYFKVQLKWPNDLLNISGEKCGGIICHYIDNNTVIVGVGINLGDQEVRQDNHYSHGFSSIPLKPFSLETLAEDIYEYVLQNRINTFEVLETEFKKTCGHLNKKIKTSDAEGIFQGLGRNGEALLLIDNQIKKII